MHIYIFQNLFYYADLMLKKHFLLSMLNTFFRIIWWTESNLFETEIFINIKNV